MLKRNLETKLAHEDIGSLVKIGWDRKDPSRCEDALRKLKKIYDNNMGGDYCLCDWKHCKTLLNIFEEWLSRKNTSTNSQR